MTFTQSSLKSKEQLISQSKQHWAVFIVPALPIVFFLVCLYLGLRSHTPGIFFFVAIAFLLSGLVKMTQALIGYFTTRLFLTNEKVVAQSGLLKRQQLEWKLSQVESINVVQPLLGRALDYGTVTIVGTGGTTKKMKSLNHPAEIRRVIATLRGETYLELP